MLKERRPLTDSLTHSEKCPGAAATARGVATTEVAEVTPKDCHSREILAAILAQRPEFGTAGYTRGRPAQPTVFERMHAPNAPGPGARWRSFGGTIKTG